MADEVSRRTQIPLLGAAMNGVMAFAGIRLGSDSSGGFLFSLFAVILIALSLSWLISATVTPLLASYVLKVEERDARRDPYVTPFLRAFVSVVRVVLKLWWLVLAGLLGGTSACFWLFEMVAQQFFPLANTLLFNFNYKAA